MAPQEASSFQSIAIKNQILEKHGSGCQVCHESSDNLIWLNDDEKVGRTFEAMKDYLHHCCRLCPRCNHQQQNAKKILSELEKKKNAQDEKQTEKQLQTQLRIRERKRLVKEYQILRGECANCGDNEDPTSFRYLHDNLAARQAGIDYYIRTERPLMILTEYLVHHSLFCSACYVARVGRIPKHFEYPNVPDLISDFVRQCADYVPVNMTIGLFPPQVTEEEKRQSKVIMGKLRANILKEAKWAKNNFMDGVPKCVKDVACPSIILRDRWVAAMKEWLQALIQGGPRPEFPADVRQVFQRARISKWPDLRMIKKQVGNGPSPTPDQIGRMTALLKHANLRKNKDTSNKRANLVTAGQDKPNKKTKTSHELLLAEMPII